MANLAERPVSLARGIAAQVRGFRANAPLRWTRAASPRSRYRDVVHEAAIRGAKLTTNYRPIYSPVCPSVRSYGSPRGTNPIDFDETHYARRSCKPRTHESRPFVRANFRYLETNPIVLRNHLRINGASAKELAGFNSTLPGASRRCERV